MLRWLFTKPVPRLICVATLLCLVRALPGELSIRVEPDRDITGDPGSCARDPASRVRDTAAIANMLSKLRPMRMRSS